MQIRPKFSQETPKKWGKFQQSVVSGFYKTTAPIPFLMASNEKGQDVILTPLAKAGKLFQFSFYKGTKFHTCHSISIC